MRMVGDAGRGEGRWRRQVGGEERSSGGWLQSRLLSRSSSLPICSFESGLSECSLSSSIPPYPHRRGGGGGAIQSATKKRSAVSRKRQVTAVTYYNAIYVTLIWIIVR